MKQTSFAQHTPLPTALNKRIEMVVATCIGVGHVNRDVLAKYYGLTKLQASILLREFFQAHVNDIRRDPKNDGYMLMGYPKKCG